MDQLLNQIYQCLQKLTGLHRQLIEIVRAEREALVQADLKAIESTTQAKQKIIEDIYQVESQRVKLTTHLAMAWKKPLHDLSISNIIIQIQSVDSKLAEQFRSVFNALTILIQRISEQNRDNRSLLEKSIEHIQKMKMNVLGEGSPKSGTYTQQGQRASGGTSSRLISKEA